MLYSFFFKSCTVISKERKSDTFLLNICCIFILSHKRRNPVPNKENISFTSLHLIMQHFLVRVKFLRINKHVDYFFAARAPFHCSI